MAKLRIPEEKQAEILRLYDEGKPAYQIGPMVGVSDGTARRVISRHRGFTERRYSSGPRNHSRPKRDYSEIVSDYKAGIPIAWIAEKHGLSRSSVSRIAISSGCKPRRIQPLDAVLMEVVRMGPRPGQTWRQLARENFVSVSAVNRMRKHIRLEGVGSE